MTRISALRHPRVGDDGPVYGGQNINFGKVNRFEFESRWSVG